MTVIAGIDTAVYEMCGGSGPKTSNALMQLSLPFWGALQIWKGRLAYALVFLIYWRGRPTLFRVKLPSFKQRY